MYNNKLVSNMVSSLVLTVGTSVPSFAATLDIEFEDLASQERFAPFVVDSDSEASGGEYIVWPEDGSEQAFLSPSQSAAGQVEVAFSLSETATVALQMRVRFADGTDDSFFYSLDSGAYRTQNGANTGDWQQLTVSEYALLGEGTHRLSIVRREDGAQIDKLTLIADAGSIELASVEYSHTIDIDPRVRYQTIRGFGGMSTVWNATGAPPLSCDQIDTAFGNGPGQLGLSLYRVRISPNAERWHQEAPAAACAQELGARILASPWTPPSYMKTNNNLIGGRLDPAYYTEYTQHLLDFAGFMDSNKAPLYAVSLQNEPDITVSYESCDWSAEEMRDFLRDQGARFGDLKVVAAESYNFNHAATDAILNDPEAVQHLDIVGGHIYGGGLTDYPLARENGKELWMTEHYTESNNSANAWPLALDVGRELHFSMRANFSAYFWWYIRRSYGLLTEDGNVSKRGYLMAQYAKFVRPGFTRIKATENPARDVLVTAYKKRDAVVMVVVNMSDQVQNLSVNLKKSRARKFSAYTTSGVKSLAREASCYKMRRKGMAITLDPQSVTTFVSSPRKHKHYQKHKHKH